MAYWPFAYSIALPYKRSRIKLGIGPQVLISKSTFKSGNFATNVLLLLRPIIDWVTAIWIQGTTH